MSMQELSPLQQAAVALKRMRAELERQHEPIAIVGMACRFPGGANDLDSFWRLLAEGRDAVGPVPRERWNAEQFYREQPEPNRFWQTYMRSGSFLDVPVDAFDADFFRISPREAAAMDPQQRLLMEVAWEALEDAGIAPLALRETSTGVYVGLITGDYGRVPLEELVPADLPYFGTGNALSFPAGRLSYFLGLQGPSMVVATECSSTLTSTHLAMQALRARECDLALSGGVSLMIYPDTSIVLSQMGALARDGRSKAFDASADGYGRGEGCGVLTLKRLSDARRDGDRVYAVLRGSAINHDGPSGGLTVPHGPAQERLLTRALASAKLEPAQVDYLEAHGTGTRLGDPIEVHAIDAVMAAGRDPATPLLIGSVKTNIGHLEAAAGVAGIIKLALALQHQQLPASLHLQTPNPAVDWAALRLEVVRAARDWPRAARERIAGVSSFGLSGINAHVLVSEPPAPAEPVAAATPPRAWQVLPLSAKSPAALSALVARWADALQDPARDANDLCHTARVGRSCLELRTAVHGATRAQLVAGLRGLDGSAQPSELALLFSGQGAQTVGMGRALFEQEPSFRCALQRCAELLDPQLPEPLLQVLYPEPDSASPIDETEWTHVALFSVQYALGQLLLGWGVRPGYLFGHSLGEFAAACLAGVFELPDALRLVRARGRLMQALPRGGAMFAVAAERERVHAALAPFREQVAIAAHNGPRQVTLSGHTPALEALVARLEAQGVVCRRLKVSHAFHSPLMEPMLDAFEAAVSEVRLRPPALTLISSLYGRPVSEEVCSPSYWRRHVREPVACADAFGWLGQRGVRLFLELGGVPVLSGMGRQCIEQGGAGPAPRWLSVLGGRRAEPECLAECMAELSACGQELDFAAYDRGRAYQRVAAPSYPWQQRSQRLELPRDYLARRQRDAQQESAQHPLLGQALPLATETRVFESSVSCARPAWLADHRVFGVAVFPGTGYLEAFLAAGAALLDSQELLLEELEFVRALALPETGSVQLQVVCAPLAMDSWQLSAHSRAAAGESWALRARARVSRALAEAPPEPEAADALLPARSVEEFYQRAGALGLAYGPSFRTLRTLAGSGERCAGELALAPGPPLEERGFHFHPALADGCLQVLGAVFAEHAADTIQLPVRIARVHVRGRLGRQLCVRARIAHAGPAGRASADFTVCAPSGELLASVSGVQFQAARPSALRAELQPQAGRAYYRELWHAEPLAQRAQQVGQRWLLLVDSEQAARPLAACLSAREQLVRVLSAPSQHELAAALQAELHGVVDLRPLALREDPAAAQAACLELVALVRGVAEHAAPPLLVSVTCGALAACDDDKVACPLAAPLHGLMRVAAREYPGLSCLALDLDLDAAHACEALAAELCARGAGLRDGELRVALRAAGRFVPRLERSELGAAQLRLRADASYLVTGGTRGVGARVVQTLAEHGARNIVAVSRSGEPADEAARAALAAARSLGARVECHAADVADESAVRDLLDWLARTLPPLRGLVHAAAMLDDASIANLDRARFAAVFAPKLIGAALLDRATRGAELDFFALFSSAATLLGSAGQGNYVAANAYLDALAEQRRANGLPATAIAWGAWAEIGVAARAGIAERLRARGMQTIEPDVGCRELARMLAVAPARIAYAPIDWDAAAELAREPLFARVAASARPAQQRAGLLTRLGPLGERDRHELLLAEVAAALGRVLGRAPEELAPEQRFFELGLDSMMAVELRDQLQRELGCNLPATLAVENSTLAALVRWLEHNVPGLRAAVQPASTPQSHTRELAPVAAAQLLEHAAGVSDAELRARLRDARGRR